MASAPRAARRQVGQRQDRGQLHLGVGVVAARCCRTARRATLRSTGSAAIAIRRTPGDGCVERRVERIATAAARMLSPSNAASPCSTPIAWIAPTFSPIASTDVSFTMSISAGTTSSLAALDQQPLGVQPP